MVFYFAFEMTLAIESCDEKELVALLMIKSGYGGKKPRSIQIDDWKTQFVRASP